jgi:tetratricopeptide (TPR) repeat protein
MHLATARVSDFELELGRLDRTLAELGGDAVSPGADTATATRHVWLLYQRASLAGDLDGCEAAGEAASRLVRRLGPMADLCLLMATVDLALHRIAEVKRHLDMADGLRDTLHGRLLQADVLFQEGQYERARQGYEGVVRDRRTWDGLARLAHVRATLGDADGADRLYREAEDELTAKQMRQYAWVELQRGLLDLGRGRHDDAAEHYRQSGRAYSGYWMIDDHLAELLAARGRLEEAAGLYERVIDRVPRPELQHVLGDLYTLMGEREQARGAYDRALAGYLASTRRGGVHYYHHLADFCADVLENGAEAVRWARRDLDLRRNPATEAALAWTLYRNGQLSEAVDLMTRALSSGVRDAHLFSRAGRLHLALGRPGEGERYLRMASDMNPRHESFHVHR